MFLFQLLFTEALYYLVSRLLLLRFHLEEIYTKVTIPYFQPSQITDFNQVFG